MTRAGAGMLLCLGAFAFDLMLLSLLGIAWTCSAVLVSLVGLAGLVVGGWVWHWRSSPRARCPRPLGSWFQGIFDVLTLAIVASYAIFATWAAPYEWDFFGIWGSKARAFFEAGGMGSAVLKIVEKPDYPPLVPLLFDFVAILHGGWDERLFGWVYIVLCAAVILIMRGMFAEEVRWPALATLAVAFPALNLWVGLAEAGVMAFGCAGVLFIRRGNVSLGAVLLGLAAWSKNEGLALIAVTALALLVSTRSIRRVLQLWPAAAVIAPWLIARSALGLSTDFMEGSVTSRVFERLSHMGDVARAFAASPPDQPWFWLAVFLTLVVFIREAIRRELFLLLVVALQFGLMVAQALTTTWDLAAHVSLTMNRLPHQIAPLAGFLAVVILFRFLDLQGDGSPQRHSAGGARTRTGATQLLWSAAARRRFGIAAEALPARISRMRVSDARPGAGNLIHSQLDHAEQSTRYPKAGARHRTPKRLRHSGSGQRRISASCEETQG